MDILTQAVLGAAVAVAVAPPAERRVAAAIGLVAGVLPDADALIQSGSDPLLVLDYHRHFTHALIAVPLLAALAALLCYPFVRRRLPVPRLLRYSLAGSALAGLLDACTSYGTHLWLPFSEARVAWNLIAVVDPLFTLALLVPLLLVLRRPQRLAMPVGLLLAAAYLGLGFLQHQRVERAAAEVALARGHAAQRLTVKPTLGNLLLWRALYVHDGRIHADALHAGPAMRHYAGASAPLLGDVPAARRADVARFRAFADDWLVADGADAVGDARYAMLPTAIRPIWRIEWDAAGRLAFTAQHAMAPAERAAWLAMLLGRDLPQPMQAQ